MEVQAYHPEELSLENWDLPNFHQVFVFDSSLRSKLFPTLELEDFHRFHQFLLRFFWELRYVEGIGTLVL